MSGCCFCHCITDVAPRPFDHTNIYQQIRVVEPRKTVFKFEAVAPDGYPTSSLRIGDFSAFSSTRKIPQLHEALGMNDTLRARLPDRDFRGRSSPSTVVGRWYCPFMFVQDRKLLLRKQVDQSPYYEMTLEQFWEEIHRCGTFGGGVDTSVSVVTCTGPTLQLHGESGEVVWVDKVVVERMRWEQERGGWEEQKGEVRLEDTNMARKSLFTCYVLVERFGLRRLDGTLLLTYDFRHTNKLEIKWE